MKFTNETPTLQADLRAAIVRASIGSEYETLPTDLSEPVGKIGSRRLTRLGLAVAALIRENEEQAARIVELEQELDLARPDLEPAIVPSQSQITKTHEELATLQSSRIIELLNERDVLKKELKALDEDLTMSTVSGAKARRWAKRWKAVAKRLRPWTVRARPVFQQNGPK